MKAFRPFLYALVGCSFLPWLLLAETEVAEYQADPVIVRAWRFEEQELDVPADITVISSKQIEQSHSQSVPELLQQEANIHVRSSNGKGNTGELSMRGFGENSGQRVLVIVDGQKMNRADMGILDWQQLPLDNIESIEVIRGGQTVLYGNHALSGVIKITTKKGGEQKIKLKASAGSFGFQEYNAFYTGSHSNLFYTAGANYQRDEGFRDNSLSWTKNANLSLGSLLGDSDTITLKTSVGENYTQFPGPLSYIEYLADPTQSVKPNDFASTTNLLTTVLWEGEREWGTVQANGGFNLRNTYSEMGGNIGINEQRGYSFSPQARVGDEKNFISGGVDLFYDTLDFAGDRETTINQAALSRITVGPFLFAQKELTKTLSLNGGARYEVAQTQGKNKEYNKSDFNPFIPGPFPWSPPDPNPNYPPKPNPATSFEGDFKKTGLAHEISLNWQPAENFSAWIGYDRVYRYPALDESAAYQGFPLNDPLNENLEPERGNNFETGVKYQIENWSASASLYYLTLENEIGYTDNYLGSGQGQNINLGATEHVGSDLELAYDKEHYGASTLWSLVRATFDGGPNDGDKVPLVPEIQNTTAVWFKPLKRVRITGTHLWLSDQFQGGDFDNTQREIKSYGLFGLKTDISITKQVSLFFKVDNLADKQYLSSAYSGVYYPGAGRSFSAGLTMEL
ncbi:MAG: TonB-dependent receptor [Kiritimatiellales bacterium]|jgi:iron complex outermembrane receptor protein